MDEADEQALRTAIPGFPRLTTWAVMRATMLVLAATPASEAMVDHLILGLQRESSFLTPELIRRELATIFAALVDPTFPEEVQTMT